MENYNDLTKEQLLAKLNSLAAIAPSDLFGQGVERQMILIQDQLSKR